MHIFLIGFYGNDVRVLLLIGVINILIWHNCLVKTHIKDNPTKVIWRFLLNHDAYWRSHCYCYSGSFLKTVRNSNIYSYKQVSIVIVSRIFNKLIHTSTNTVLAAVAAKGHVSPPTYWNFTFTCTKCSETTNRLECSRLVAMTNTSVPVRQCFTKKENIWYRRLRDG